MSVFLNIKWDWEPELLVIFMELSVFVPLLDIFVFFVMLLIVAYTQECLHWSTSRDTVLSVPEEWLTVKRSLSDMTKTRTHKSTDRYILHSLVLRPIPSFSIGISIYLSCEQQLRSLPALHTLK